MIFLPVRRSRVACSADGHAGLEGVGMRCMVGAGVVKPQALLLGLSSLLLTGSAMAQAVVLSGTMGNRALLVVDGAAPKSVAVGDTHAGVKLLALNADQATIESRGQRSTLRVGDAPVSVGGAMKPGSGGRIVLPQGQGGHFFADGMVNGRSMRFMVDTGATTVALGVDDARRIGLSFDTAPRINMSTANGVAAAWRVKLHSVRINDVEVFDVDAIVGPNMPYALLGNSFLGRFNMNRTSDTMVLERR